MPSTAHPAEGALCVSCGLCCDNGMFGRVIVSQWEALKLVMDLHEEQLAQATVHDIEKAHDFVYKVLTQGKARAIVQTMKEET